MTSDRIKINLTHLSVSELLEALNNINENLKKVNPSCEKYNKLNNYKDSVIMELSRRNSF